MTGCSFLSETCFGRGTDPHYEERMERFYTGIGSREATLDVCEKLERIAIRLAELDYVLRSGGAKGADRAFQRGAESVHGVTEIYKAKGKFKHMIPAWCFEEVKKHMPPNRPPFDSMEEHTRKLLARNMLQVLGEDGQAPSEFLVCWTPAGLTDGGTGYALRCAVAHGVMTYNLRNPIEEKAFDGFLRELEENHVQATTG